MSAVVSAMAEEFRGFSWFYRVGSALGHVQHDACESHWALLAGEPLPQLLDGLLTHKGSCPGRPPHEIEAAAT